MNWLLVPFHKQKDRDLLRTNHPFNRRRRNVQKVLPKTAPWRKRLRPSSFWKAASRALWLWNLNLLAWPGVQVHFDQTAIQVCSRVLNSSRRSHLTYNSADHAGYHKGLEANQEIELKSQCVGKYWFSWRLFDFGSKGKFFKSYKVWNYRQKLGSL